MKKLSMILSLICILLINNQLVISQDQIDGYKKLVFDEKYGLKNQWVTFVMEDTISDVTWFKSEKCVFKYMNDTLYTFKIVKSKLVKYSNGEISNKIITATEKYLFKVFYEKKYWIDNKNNIWIAENDQLTKFDGLNLKIYELGYDYLSSINAITEDLNGDIWLSMGAFGLSKLSGEKFLPVKVNNVLVGNEVYLTYVDNKNNIWFCFDRGLIVYDGGKFLTYVNDSINIKYCVCSLIEVDDTTLWLSSYKGHVSCFNGKDWHYVHIEKKYIYRRSLQIGGYGRAYEATDWLSTADASTFPSMLIMDKNGNLYLQDWDEDVYELDNTTSTIIDSIRYPWKSRIGTANLFSYYKPSPSDIHKMGQLINKFINMFQLEDIDKIDWLNLKLLYVDQHKNIWFRGYTEGRSNITLLKKV
jgi:hypothetical protein